MEDAVFEPMVVSRSSVEGRVMTKWLVAARKRLGGTFPRPDAREQMEDYAKRMRDMKARKGRKKKKKSKADRIVDASEVSFGHVHLTAASTAILNLWVKKAKHSIVSRSNEVAATLRAEQAALLSQIHESEDWYYGAEMRLDGHKIKKEGEQIYEDRKSKEEEARAKRSMLRAILKSLGLKCGV